MKFFKLKVLLWPILLIVIVFIGATGAAAASGAINTLALGSLFTAASAQSNDQVVRSIHREEQVVLLRLGVTGIADKKTNARIGTFEIPWTDRALFLRYSFDAKLGIDGKDVKIEATGDNKYRVSIPSFIFIGADDEKASVAVEQNGVLSWTQPEIDDQQLRNDILNDAAKTEHIKDNSELLRDQARNFYSRIAYAIDPHAELEFTFADDATPDKGN